MAAINASANATSRQLQELQAQVAALPLANIALHMEGIAAAMLALNHTLNAAPADNLPMHVRNLVEVGILVLLLLIYRRLRRLEVTAAKIELPSIQPDIPPKKQKRSLSTQTLLTNGFSRGLTVSPTLMSTARPLITSHVQFDEGSLDSRHRSKSVCYLV